MRWIGVIALVGGCVASDVTRCEDGRLCPSGRVCDEARQVCVLPHQLTVCVGVDDGAPCDIVGVDDGVCAGEVCVAAGCGDGYVVLPEECDGANIPAGLADCTDHGFHVSAPVTCDDDCEIDTSACSGACGDGVIDGGAERCDPGLTDETDDDLLDGQTCLDFGYYAADGLNCSAACTFDVSACTGGTCGDDAINGNEECDGDDLGSVDDCLDLGFQDAGPVSCTGACDFDTSQCTGTCGDGLIGGTEVCDPGSGVIPEDLDGQTCLDFGFYEQDGLSCSAACTFDVSACVGRCGDGILDPVEDCDPGTSEPGDELYAGDCTDLGFYHPGTIGCTASCGFDDGACEGFCGDRDVEASEACEGAPPDDLTCLDLGYESGFLGCSASCAPDLSTCSRPSWTTLPSVSTANLRGIWGTGPSDVFAVGDGGVIVHWNGVTWTAMASGTTQSLFAIWGTGASNVYAVGASGTILRYDGAAWSAMTSGTGVSLNGVWASGATDVFVVGDEGTILHGDGASWTPMSSGTTATLYSVWGSGPNDVFAGGSLGLVLRYTGAWSPTTTVGIVSPIIALSGSSSTNVFAGGGYQIMRWNGSSWTFTTVPAGSEIRAIWAQSASNAYAIGLDGSGSSATIFQFDGTAWTPIAHGATGSLLDVWGSGAADVYAAGVAGMMMHTDGSAWRSMPTGGNTIYGMWAAARDDVFIVSPGGSILRGNDEGWSSVSSGTSKNLWAIDNGFAVGVDGTIVRWNGTSFSPMSSNTSLHLFTVWSSGADDAYAAGYGLHHWDGNSWSLIGAATTDRFTGIWGSGPDDVYVIESTGQIRHWDGSAWGTVATGLSLTGVWGTGPNNVFVVGGGGVIRHFDGTGWTSMDSGTTQNLLSVFGSGPGDVYAGTSTGVLHWDGTRWSPMSNTSGNNFRCGVAAGNVYAGANIAGGLAFIRPRACLGSELRCDDAADDDCDGRTDCLDADCASACTGGGQCAGATPLVCDVPTDGSTSLGASAINRYACDPVMEVGREKVYTLTPAAGTVAVALTGLTDDLDLIVLAEGEGGTCDPGFPGCLDASSTTGDETVTFTADGTSTYYVVVDGFGGAAGPFTITADCP